MNRRICMGLVFGVLMGAGTQVAAEDDPPAPKVDQGVDQEKADQETFDPHKAQLGFGVRDTPAARFALTDARKLMARGETMHGLRAIQRVLDDMPNDFFLIPDGSTAGSILWRSAAEVAREMLAELNSKDRAAYNDLIGDRARALIVRALSSGDAKLLREVLRRFGASTMGLRAARLLTELSLEAGRWRDAARYAHEGLRFAPKDGALWRRTMDALRAAGDRAALRDLKIPTGVSVQRKGQAVDALTERARLVAALPAAAQGADWPMWGGAADRGRVLTAKPPIPKSLRWRERLSVAHRRLDSSNPTRWRNRPSKTANTYRLLNSRIYPVQPVTAGRTLYTADGRSIRAYDTFSGRSIWHYNDETARQVQLVTDDPAVPLDGRSSLERAYAPVVSDGFVVASIERMQAYDESKLQGVVIEAAIPMRCLVALDQATGEERWTRMGNRDIELSNASVISPPVVSEGLVIALISQYSFNHNLSFVAFDLASGALRWKRSLGFGQQELNLFGYPTKELAGSAVAAADGVAYASTGLGFVAAVDLRSGVPRWLASYEPIEILPVEFWSDAPVRAPLVAASPPIIHGDSLIIAPTDSSFVYVYDRTTGKLRWRARHTRTGMSPHTLAHLIGVANDGKRDVVILTDRVVRALDLETGAPAWLGRLNPESAEVVGRGVLAGGIAVIPTATGLQHFSINGEGKFLGRHPWPEGSRSGNVLATGRALIVTSRNMLYSFFDWKDIEAEADRRMRENPDDPTALLEAGELYWKGRQLDRARTAFERALTMKGAQSGPALRRARQGLMRTWISAGEFATDQTDAVRDMKKAMAYADTDADKVVIHLALHQLPNMGLDQRIQNLTQLVTVSGEIITPFRAGQDAGPLRARARLELAALLQAGGRASDAVDVLQHILRDDRRAILLGNPASEFARKRIAGIIRGNGRESYAKHDKAAQALLATVSGEGATQTLRTILEQYPNAKVVSEVLSLRAAQRLADNDGPGAADDLLELLDRQTKPDEIASTLASLHAAWTAAGARGAARYVAVSMAEAYADVSFEVDGKPYTGASFAKTLPAPNVPDATPLTVPLKEVLSEPAMDDIRISRVLHRDDLSGGLAPIRLAFRSDFRLLAFDITSRTVAWTVPCRSCRRAGWSPYGLVTASGVYGRDLEGRDPATGKARWKVPLGRFILDMAMAHGQVFTLTKSRSSRADYQLDAFDITGGRRLWTRPLGNVEHRRLGVSGDRLFVERATLADGRIVVDVRIFDGLRGSTVGKLEIPGSERGPKAQFDHTFVFAYRDSKRRGTRVAAWSLRDATATWDILIEGGDTIQALTPAPGGRLVVLRGNGDLITLDTGTGAVAARTRIFVGTKNVRTFPNTVPQVHEGLYLFVPSVRPPSQVRLAAYELRTGKLKWDAVLSKRRLPTSIDFGVSGRTAWILSTTRSNLEATQVILAAVDTGKRLQRLTPKGLTRHAGLSPGVTVGHGSLMLIGDRAAAIWSGEPATTAAPSDAPK